MFLAIFVFVMVGPHIWVLDLSEQDSTLTNLPPSNNMMQVPKALLDNGVKDISSGNTYGVGIDNKGELYTWGHTRITDKIDVANIPDENQERRSGADCRRYGSRRRSGHGRRGLCLGQHAPSAG